MLENSPTTYLSYSQIMPPPTRFLLVNVVVEYCLKRQIYDDVDQYHLSRLSRPDFFPLLAWSVIYADTDLKRELNFAIKVYSIICVGV